MNTLTKTKGKTKKPEGTGISFRLTAEQFTMLERMAAIDDRPKSVLLRRILKQRLHQHSDGGDDRILLINQHTREQRPHTVVVRVDRDIARTVAALAKSHGVSAQAMQMSLVIPGLTDLAKAAGIEYPPVQWSYKNRSADTADAAKAAIG